MEEDLEVDFALSEPNSFAANAIVHLEYLGNEGKQTNFFKKTTTITSFVQAKEFPKQKSYFFRKKHDGNESTKTIPQHFIASLILCTGTSRPRRLSSLPVPLGVRRGAVVFECGSAVRRAGRHRAYITVNGERVAQSEVMKVGQFPGKNNK